MTSPDRLMANRANAEQSTGPKTVEGLARSSRNALKHGLLSRDVRLADEDELEFEAFENDLLVALAPVGGLERALAARAMAAAWRLRRFERIEALLLSQGRSDWRTDTPHAGAGFVEHCVHGDVFSKLSRYEASVERSFLRALSELQRLQSLRHGRVHALPEVAELEISSSGST